MKKITALSFLRRAFAALAASVLLPVAASAASEPLDVQAIDLDSVGPFRTGETILFRVYTIAGIDDSTIADPSTFWLNFRMGTSTRKAYFVGVDDLTGAGYNDGILFGYEVQASDSLSDGHLYPGTSPTNPKLFGGSLTYIRSAAGNTFSPPLSSLSAPDPTTPLVDQIGENTVSINPRVDINVTAVELDNQSHGTRLTGQRIGIFVKVEPMLDENTLPSDFALTFYFSEKDGPRFAEYSSIEESPTTGEECLFFTYTIAPGDYSAGNFYLYDNAPLFHSDEDASFSAVRTVDGDRTKGLPNYVYPSAITPVASDVRVNPENASPLQFYFIDLDGNPIDRLSTPLTEGDRNVGFVVDIGRVPPAPVTVTVDWSTANIFGTAQTQDITFTTRSAVTNFIDKILDNDGILPYELETEYIATATRSDSGTSVDLKVKVKNADPEFVGLGAPDSLFGASTNNTYAVGATIESSVDFTDVALELDEPFTVTWSYGGVIATDTAISHTPGSTIWTSTSSGQLKEGRTTVSVTVKDKNGGSVSTNLTFFTEQGPILYANVATEHENLFNLGNGTISIIQPGGGTVVWDPVNGTRLPADPAKNDGRLLANPYDNSEPTANGYDSYIYKWFCEADAGKETSADDYVLKKGSIARSAEATVNLWSDYKTKLIYASPTVEYLFSRELYRPDNFGDIDGDGLGDVWEMANLSESAKQFQDSNGNPVLAQESGAAAPDGSGGVAYDFSGSGNMDGDGLPANCMQTLQYLVEQDITLEGGFVIPIDVYNVNTFRYPLDANTIKTFGYFPLGSTRISGAENLDVVRFQESPYVDEKAKNRIATLFVNFSNELEFRGVGEYLDFDDGFEKIDFRPVGDGDDPGTSPALYDTDTDGLPDGWEYYFWAVAYYKVGSDKWLAFDGKNPAAGYTYKGTGKPIDRQDILDTFKPTKYFAHNVTYSVDSEDLSEIKDLADLDNDGLNNYEEFLLGTSPIQWDTDGDGLPDGWEVEFGVLDADEPVITTDEEGNTVITINDTSSTFLNPLKADSDYNADGDFFACYRNADTGEVLKHFDVFEAFDFDPRTGWHDAGSDKISYAGNEFDVTYVNTEKFTALEEFNVAAWRLANGYPAPVANTGSKAYWGHLTTDPGSPDTDTDGMPDGWELYVGYNQKGSDFEISPNSGKSEFYNGDTDSPPNASNNASEGDPIADNESKLGNHRDGLDNLHEFLCTAAVNVYPYLKSSVNGFLGQIEAWPNKPWPTNPQPSFGIGFADGCDTDGDQILDSYEKSPNANPTCVDTDHDWLPDAWECYYGTDPLFRDAFLDYDGDGLANWQEYLTGAVWPWQYDKWYDLARISGGFGPKGPGYGEVDMFDFFTPAGFVKDAAASTYGGFGRQPHAWDVAYGARSRLTGRPDTEFLYFFLAAEPRNGLFTPKLIPAEAMTGHGLSEKGEPRNDTNFNETIVDNSVGKGPHVTDSRWTYSQLGVMKFATTDPWNVDSDNDGMDDYYETYHALNPLFGGQMLDGESHHDLVGKIDPLTLAPYPSPESGKPYDLISYPWLVGDPDADPDKDGLSTREESANFYVGSGTHHTDPTPYWITDPSYERSFVNLYYQPGRVLANGIASLNAPALWFFGHEQAMPPQTPRYAFDFEINEGYDTDNDNVPDRSELTTDELASKADPLDSDTPRRRKALHLNGVDAAARTRGGYLPLAWDRDAEVAPDISDLDDLRNFTVEAWICPVDPSAGHPQTIIERSAEVKQDSAQGSINAKRLNFRLSITGDGRLRGEVHNYQGAHVTAETTAENAGLRAGVWTHVALTYSGSPAAAGALTVFRNGVAIASSPSSLQAFNGILPNSLVEYADNTVSNATTYVEVNYTYYPCSIVVGASDTNPNATVNGSVIYAHGGAATPGTEPVLEDFFQGWIDEVRVWNGAASAESILSRMRTRMDRTSIDESTISPRDKVSGNLLSIRYHYAFDNLPDTEPAADRDPAATIYSSDVTALPFGFSDLFTAPKDGSYPGIRWWDTSLWCNYRYDSRHLPLVENTCAHVGRVPIRDVPRVKASYATDGSVLSWSEEVWQASYGSTVTNSDDSVDQLTAKSGLSSASLYEGLGQAADALPNRFNPYIAAYHTIDYIPNSEWDAASNTVYHFQKYIDGEGLIANGNSFDTLEWASDLIALGGAVADIDVELWDGLGVGYYLASVDSDGDGIPDWWESLNGLDPTDSSDAWDDDDNDGLDNVAEYLAGTLPNAQDSDGDGYSDFFARDTDKSLTYGELYDDGDLMPSWWEYAYGLNPRRHDADDDPDGDGWSNYAEYLAGSDPKQASNFPVPPVVANVTYDGNRAAGTVVLYAWHDAEMQGRPDAVYALPVNPKDQGVLKVEKEYLATVHEGQRTYSGKLAFANIVNDDDFAIEVYQTESVHWESHKLQGERKPDMYCRHCGITYPYDQMIELSGGGYRCPKGHGPVCSEHTDVACYITIDRGRSTRLTSGVNAYGTINYDTGDWTVTLPDEEDAGFTLVATYNTTPEAVFPVSMRRKWTSVLSSSDPSILQGGHLREGPNRFFAFLDLDGDYLYDQGEPAGLSLFFPHNVGVGTIELTIPLTDTITGYPRFGWDAVPGCDEYYVSVAGLADLDVFKQPVSARTFFMEHDLTSSHGVNLGAGTAPDVSWSVFTNVNDTIPYAEGTVSFDVISAPATRKEMSIIAPAQDSVVSDASLVVQWKMDWRNEAVIVNLVNTDKNAAYIRNAVYNFPQRVGSVFDDYFFQMEPQKIFGDRRYAELPDGHYTLTLTEYIQSEAAGLTKQSKSVNFIIDRVGAIDPNAKVDPLGTISGTIRYYGKVPFSASGEVVGTFNGTQTLLSGALMNSPTPGSFSVYVVQGASTNFVASDSGAQDGYTRQALHSSYGSMIQTGSYVTYGENPSVSLELDTPPVAGSQLVVSYKQYSCPIRIQAFSTGMDDGASFSGAPTAQTSVYNKGAFTVHGLPQGTYYLRAFIDQNGDNVCNEWETVGYAMKVVRSDIGINNFAAIPVPPGASNIDIVLYDRDTDADQLPDSWEYHYSRQKHPTVTDPVALLALQGGFSSWKSGLYLWEEYADGELDSNPLVEDTDGDGLPDVIEHQVGSDNHKWDTDGDGIGDLEEFLAGSNPVDASSKARFAAPAPILLEDGTPAFVLPTPYLAKGTYLWYEILAKESLADKDWISVANNEENEVGIPKDSVEAGCPAGTVTILDESGKGLEAGFYKVKAHFGSDTILE